MGLRPLSNRDAIQPWMGHWPSSTLTLESERCSRVVGRGIDPESCDYVPESINVFNLKSWAEPFLNVLRSISGKIKQSFYSIYLCLPLPFGPLALQRGIMPLQCITISFICEFSFDYLTSNSLQIFYLLKFLLYLENYSCLDFAILYVGIIAHWSVYHGQSSISVVTFFLNGTYIMGFMKEQ